MSRRSGEGQSGGANIGGSHRRPRQVYPAPSAAALDEALRPLIEAVRAAPAEAKPEAEAKLAALKQEAGKGEKADDGVMAKLVDGLVGTGAGSVERRGQRLCYGMAGPVTEFVLDKLRGELTEDSLVSGLVYRVGHAREAGIVCRAADRERLAAVVADRDRDASSTPCH